MQKPPQIIELEKHLGFELEETKNIEDILDWEKSKTYLLDDKGEVIGLNLYSCGIKNISFLQNFLNLTSLNLGVNQISDIYFLQKLTNLDTLDLNFNQISDFGFLSNLNNLTNLNLSSSQILNIKFLTNLTNLTSLNISSNKIVNFDCIKNLINLVYLNISDNHITNINFLENLINIENLNLAANQIEDVNILEKLEKIKNLHLSCCKIEDTHILKKLQNLTILSLSLSQIIDYNFLEYLPNLTELNLGSHEIADYSSLKKLTNLKKLLICRSLMFDISFLENMSNLTHLELWNNKIIDISFLKGLTNLKTLDLSGNQITNISSLKKLLNLKKLNLSGNQSVDILPLTFLTNLEYLSLRGNQIIDANSLANLTKLTNLDVDSNQITNIDFLNNLRNLTKLNLGYNQITDIPLNFLDNFPNLQEISLVHNDIFNIPNVIISSYNCFEPLKAYLEGVKKGSVLNNRVKVILVGNSSVGKTHLVERLINEDNANFEQIKSTHGIIVEECEIDFLPEIPTLEISFWDFGGQEYYHATHSLFFSENALYLLLWAEDTPDSGFYPTKIKYFDNEEKKDVFLEHHNPLYWLKEITHYSKNKQGIFFIKNKIDVFDKQKTLPIPYENVDEVFKISTITNENITHLENQIINYFKKNKEKFAFKVGKFWVLIKECLQDDSRHWITYTEYERICNEIHEEYAEKISKQEIFELCKYLHQSGVVLFFDDNEKLKNKVYLKPISLSQTIYNVLNNSVISNDGEFTLEQVEYFYKCISGILESNKILEATQQDNFINDYLQELQNLKENPEQITDAEITALRMQFDILHINLELDEENKWIDTLIEIFKENTSNLDKETLIQNQQNSIILFQNYVKIHSEEIINLMKEFELIFEIKGNSEKYVAPQYLPQKIKEIQNLRNCCYLSNPEYIFSIKYVDFLPKSIFTRFIAVYGHFCEINMYSKTEIYFANKNRIGAYITCDYNNCVITFYIQNKDKNFAKEMFETLYHIDSSENLAISIDEIDFVYYKKLQNKIKNQPQAKEIETISGKNLNIEDFGFLLHDFTNQKNIFNQKTQTPPKMHTETHPTEKPEITKIPAPSQYAFIVGVGKRAEDAEGMTITKNDAIQLKDKLIATGVPAENVICLVDTQATKDNILKYLDELIQKTKENKASLCYVFFSGHGYKKENNFYLICNDTTKDNWQAEVLNGKNFTQKLKEINTEKMFVMLDCCHAGAITGLENTNLPIDDTFFKGENCKNRVVLTSSHAEEVSYLSKPVSLFTFALINGLHGAYLQGNEKDIKIFDLSMYVRECVMSLMKFIDKNGKQSPQLNVLEDSETSNFTLITYPKGKSSTTAFDDILEPLTDKAGKKINVSQTNIPQDTEYREKFNWIMKNDIKIDGNGNVVVAGVNGNNNIINNNITNYYGGNDNTKNTENNNLNTEEVSDVEAFKNKMLAILARDKHLGINEILTEIDKNFSYEKEEYNRTKWVSLNSKSAIAIEMMAESLIQETKSLIHSIKN